jgi:hypothetical protein
MSQNRAFPDSLLALLSQEVLVTNLKRIDLPHLFPTARFFSDRLLAGQASGEMALRWAVFVDGLRRYCKLAANLSARTYSQFEEEERWVLANDAGWPFSFTNLCETFGLNPQSVRSMLVAWKRAHLTTLGQEQWEKESLA